MTRNILKVSLSILLALIVLIPVITISASAFNSEELKTLLDEKIEANLKVNYDDFFKGGTLNKTTNVITFQINQKRENMTFSKMVASVQGSGALATLFDSLEELCVGDSPVLRTARITINPNSDSPYIINYKGLRYSNLRGDYLGAFDVKCIIGIALLEKVGYVASTALKDFSGISLDVRFTGTSVGNITASVDYTVTFESSSTAAAGSALSFTSIRSFDPSALLG